MMMTDDQKKDYIAAHWRTVTKKEICRTVHCGERMFETYWHQLHEDRRVPAKRVLQKDTPEHMRPVVSDEDVIRYIVDHNKTDTKAKMMADLKVGPKRFCKIYKEVAAAGLIIPRVHGGAYYPERAKVKTAHAKVKEINNGPLSMPWVPEKFVKQNCRWLAA